MWVLGIVPGCWGLCLAVEEKAKAWREAVGGDRALAGCVVVALSFEECQLIFKENIKNMTVNKGNFFCFQ